MTIQRRAVPSLVFTITALCSVGRAHHSGAQLPIKPPAIEVVLEDIRARNNIPALALVATRGEKILEIGVSGLRRADGTERVTAADRFHIGSNAKAMTATVLAMLVEQKKLAWDTKPLDFFPEWKDRVRAEYNAVTLTDLLAHRAGIPAYDDTESPEFIALECCTGTPVEQRRQFAQWVLSHAPAVPPGTTRLYSNAGFAVAAAMGERAAGESWESLMRARLFEPLGIHPTFEWPAHDDVNQPWGHVETETGVVPHDPKDSYQLPAFLVPAGSLSIAPGDYAKFLQLHLRGLEKHDGLLKAETIARLHTPVDDKTALGWGITEFEGAKASVHTGSAGTFYAVVALWPSRDLALAAFANAGDKRAHAACVEALKLVGRYETR